MQQRHRHTDERRLVLVVQSTSGSGAERSVDVVAVAGAGRRRCRVVGRGGSATAKPAEPRGCPAHGARRTAAPAAARHDAGCRQRHRQNGRDARRHDDPVQPYRPRDGRSLLSPITRRRRRKQ